MSTTTSNAFLIATKQLLTERKTDTFKINAVALNEISRINVPLTGALINGDSFAVYQKNQQKTTFAPIDLKAIGQPLTDTKKSFQLSSLLMVQTPGSSVAKSTTSEPLTSSLGTKSTGPIVIQPVTIDTMIRDFAGLSLAEKEELRNRLGSNTAPTFNVDKAVYEVMEEQRLNREIDELQGDLKINLDQFKNTDAVLSGIANIKKDQAMNKNLVISSYQKELKSIQVSTADSQIKIREKAEAFAKFQSGIDTIEKEYQTQLVNLKKGLNQENTRIFVDNVIEFPMAKIVELRKIILKDRENAKVAFEIDLKRELDKQLKNFTNSGQVQNASTIEKLKKYDDDINNLNEKLKTAGVEKQTLLNKYTELETQLKTSEGKLATELIEKNKLVEEKKILIQNSGTAEQAKEIHRLQVEKNGLRLIIKDYFSVGLEQEITLLEQARKTLETKIMTEGATDVQQKQLESLKQQIRDKKGVIKEILDTTNKYVDLAKAANLAIQSNQIAIQNSATEIKLLQSQISNTTTRLTATATDLLKKTGNNMPIPTTAEKLSVFINLQLAIIKASSEELQKIGTDQVIDQTKIIPEHMKIVEAERKYKEKVDELNFKDALAATEASIAILKNITPDTLKQLETNLQILKTTQVNAANIEVQKTQLEALKKDLDLAIKTQLDAAIGLSKKNKQLSRNLNDLIKTSYGDTTVKISGPTSTNKEHEDLKKELFEESGIKYLTLKGPTMGTKTEYLKHIVQDLKILDDIGADYTRRGVPPKSVFFTIDHQVLNTTDIMISALENISIQQNCIIPIMSYEAIQSARGGAKLKALQSVSKSINVEAFIELGDYIGPNQTGIDGSLYKKMYIAWGLIKTTTPGFPSAKEGLRKAIQIMWTAVFKAFINKTLNPTIDIESEFEKLLAEDASYPLTEVNRIIREQLKDKTSKVRGMVGFGELYSNMRSLGNAVDVIAGSKSLIAPNGGQFDVEHSIETLGSLTPDLIHAEFALASKLI